MADCAIPGICRYIDAGGLLNVRNNASGCGSETDVLEYCTALLVPDGAQNPSHFLYPNPAHRVFYIDPALSSSLQFIFIFGSLGRQAMKAERVEHEVDISGLAAGIYTVVMATRGKTCTSRLAVE